MHWTGASPETNNPLTVLVDGRKAIQAIFGASLNPPTNVILNPRAALYPFGSTIQVTVIPPAGQALGTFAGIRPTNNPFEITLTDADPSDLTPIFEVLAPTGRATLTTFAREGGTVSVEPAGLYFLLGARIMVQAMPASGWVFDFWSGGATGSTNPLSVYPLESSKVIQANFRRALQPVVIGPKLAGNLFSVSVATEIGPKYYLESKDSLTDASWAVVQTLSGSGGSITLSDSAARTGSRFYRIRID